MFILGKIKILQGAEDIAEMAYLLYACLYWAIMLSPADVQCDLIDGKQPILRLFSKLIWLNC